MGLSWMRNELVGASLDHAIWFHRDARCGRMAALRHGCTVERRRARNSIAAGIFTQAGELVASVGAAKA